MKRLFLVDDNRLLLEASAAHLRSEGFEVHTFQRLEGLTEQVARWKPHLIIYDIELPDGNSLEQARNISILNGIPFMFLTAKSSETDRIIGLEAGAEDYLIKPFSNRELALRAQAIVRRTSMEESTPVKSEFEIWINDLLELRVDARNHIGSIAGEDLKLTGSEWKILEYLLARPGEFCSRGKILVEALGYQFCGSTRTVDTHVKNLRIKLRSPSWIETVRNSGYRFRGVQA